MSTIKGCVGSLELAIKKAGAFFLWMWRSRKPEDGVNGRVVAAGIVKGTRREAVQAANARIERMKDRGEL